MSRARILADYVSSGDELAATTATADAALPKAGGAMTGAITTNSTFDGVDVGVRDGEHAPKASPAFTGTPTGITATHVGLGNVTNESKATMFTSPTFTGNAVLGTPASGTMTNMQGTPSAINLVNATYPAGHLLQVKHYGCTSGSVYSTSAAFTGNAIASGTFSPHGGGNNLSYMFAILVVNVESLAGINESRLILETQTSGADVLTNLDYDTGDWAGTYSNQGRTYGGISAISKIIRLDGSGNADIDWQFSVRNTDASASSSFTVYKGQTGFAVYEYQG